MVSETFPVVSVAEMRALEAAAIEAGASERELQERAGRTVAEAVSERVARSGVSVAVLVGAGNNGRDAVVAGRYLAEWGHSVQIWLGPRHSLEPAEIAALGAAGIGVSAADVARRGEDLRRSLAQARVAIDGLLGIGARGPMRAELAEIAGLLNEARAARPDLLVVSVDLPSGVNADDGSIPGAAVRADVTVTFGAVKAGLLRFPAAELVGTLEPRPIGLPAEQLERLPIRILDLPGVRPSLPSRPLDAHKYRFGRVLVVAGSGQFIGAAYLCAASAARSGCGLVAVATTDAVKRVLASRLPEATYPTPTLGLERDAAAAADSLVEALPDYQALVLGPGIGRSAVTARFLTRLLEANARASQPVSAIIDADALNLLASWDGWWERIGPGHVLTPHAAEMGRLAGMDARRVAEGAWHVAREHAQRWRQVVVLKGPFTTVASPDGHAWVYPRANPGLATAGTGDVLAGLCGGLVAQGCSPLAGARLAVVVHAVAGRLVLEERAWRTLLASDLIEQIPRVLRSIG